jgi:hypothetical protein
MKDRRPWILMETSSIPDMINLAMLIVNGAGSRHKILIQAAATTNRHISRTGPIDAIMIK